VSWTKQQLIEAALTEIGIASYEYDIQAGELASGLNRLDAMMADWNARGIRLGFPLYSDPDNSSVTEESGLKDSAVEAVIINLAQRLAPSYGRQVSRETKVTAKKALDTLLMRAGVSQPVEKQFPETLPKGAGYKTWRHRRDPFFNQPTDPVDAGPDSVLDLL